MVNAATQGGVGLDGFLERPGIAAYLRLGYGPQTAEFRANGRIAGASVTLEWSVDDFAISRFADSLGDTATAAVFQNRSQYWQNLFNPTTGYISPRSAAGFFPDGPGFVAYPSGFGQDGYDEGNAEQYLWWVPHNVAGLVTALGGRTAVVKRLDRFTKSSTSAPTNPICGPVTSPVSRPGCTTTSANRGKPSGRSTGSAGCSARHLAVRRATTTSAPCPAGMSGLPLACIRAPREPPS